MNINHTKMTLEINSCKNYEILEVRQGDKGSRIIDFAFTVNGEIVELASTMSAKVNATVDDVIVADSVAAVIDTENNVVTVTLTDTMLALSGICKMDIVLTEGDEIITAETVCLRVGKSVINDDSKAFPGASSIVEITKEVENARGSSNSLGIRLNGIDSSVSDKADKSTVSQLSARMQTAEKALTGKEDNSNKVSSKRDITDSSTNYPSVKYLDDYYYSANEIYSSEEADELLGNKADVNSVYSKTETDNSLREKANKAEVDDVKAFVGYTDNDIIGVCVDYENKTFTRLAGAVGLSQGVDFNKFEMFGGRRRCNVSDDGTIVAYYGDENYAEDGSNGQVMVYQPAFYYKVVPLKLEKNSDSGIGYHLRKANYYVSPKPKTGFKLHPAFRDENGNAIDYILLSAYEGSLWDTDGGESGTGAYILNDAQVMSASTDKFCSVAGAKPASGQTQKLTKPNIEQMANNRGSGWHLETIKATSANQLLMMIELSIMNTQTGVGQGVVSITDNTSYNCSSLTGSTASLGNATGQATETINEIGGTETAYNVNGKVSVSYRGVENPWGNIWKHVQGINIWGDGTMCGGQPFVAEDFAFNESKHSDNYKGVGFTLANANGYIKAMGYGSEQYDWLLMPSEIGGTSALPVGDYFYAESNLNGYRLTRFGGCYNNFSQAGGFNWRGIDNVDYRSRVIGGRLVYIPTAKSGNAPSKSYSAPEVDSLLATKYDSSNIELGTATLTPYSTQIDKIKSATCLYEKIGDIVIVNVTVIMNETSLGRTSSIALLNMPFSNKSDVIVHDIGISKNGGIFRGSVNKSAWLQFTLLNKQAYNFVADEQVNFSLIYKI